MKEPDKRDKPEKIIYDNQKEIHDQIFHYLKSLFKDINCEAYLVGSSTTGKFGKYNEIHNDQSGSDIDVVVFLEEIPSTWEKLDTEKDWWNLYRIGKLKINNTTHFADAMIVKKDKENVAIKKFKELGWNVEKIK